MTLRRPSPVQCPSPCLPAVASPFLLQSCSFPFKTSPFIPGIKYHPSRPPSLIFFISPLALQTQYDRPLFLRPSGLFW